METGGRGRDFAEIEREFDGQGYGAFKTAVGEAVVELLRPIREETERLLADRVCSKVKSDCFIEVSLPPPRAAFIENTEE